MARRTNSGNGIRCHPLLLSGTTDRAPRIRLMLALRFLYRTSGGWRGPTIFGLEPAGGCSGAAAARAGCRLSGDLPQPGHPAHARRDWGSPVARLRHRGFSRLAVPDACSAWAAPVAVRFRRSGATERCGCPECLFRMGGPLAVGFGIAGTAERCACPECLFGIAPGRVRFRHPTLHSRVAARERGSVSQFPYIGG